MKTRRIVISTVLLVGGLLSIVQVMPKNPLLIGERLFPYGGWIQVILAMLYTVVGSAIRCKILGNVPNGGKRA